MTLEDEMNPFMRAVNDIEVEKSPLIPAEELVPSHSTKGRFNFASHFILFTVTSVFWMSIFMVLTMKQPSRPSQDAAQTQRHDHHHHIAEAPNLITGATYVACGRSTEEAKELGCVYDILSNHWVPAPCMDQDAVDVYKADETWFGYADENRTQILTIEDMSMAPFYYTNMHDHVLHCASLWKKQFREFFGQRKALDSMIVDEHHTIHCADFLIRMTQFGPELRDVPIKVEVGYAGCHIRDY